MSKSFNNKIMLIVFLVLAGIFILTKVFVSKRSERTLNTELVDIDTNRVTQIFIYPGSEHIDEIRFDKKVPAWTVSTGEVSAEADPNSVSRLMNELLNLKTDRLVARSRDKWKEYHVDDSLGSRIMIKEGKRTTLDMLVGKFNYQQPAGAYGGYRQNYGTGLTYVRLHSNDEVFSVEGFLSMMVNQPFNSWRIHTLLQLNKDHVSRISFDYPSDSGFVIQKTENLWLVDGILADSANVAEYLSDISMKTISSFWDDLLPDSSPQFTITIDRSNMDPLLVEAYQQMTGEYILHSSLNPDSWFTSSRDGTFDDLFKPKSLFLNPLP